MYIFTGEDPDNYFTANKNKVVILRDSKLKDAVTPILCDIKDSGCPDFSFHQWKTNVTGQDNIVHDHTFNIQEIKMDSVCSYFIIAYEY